MMEPTALIPKQHLPSLHYVHPVDGQPRCATDTPAPPQVLHHTQRFDQASLASKVEAEERTMCVAGPAGGSDSENTPLPQVGDVVAGCEIVETIGRGGFGLVYLARQVGLANRPVVLKLTRGVSEEPERLAALQHAHIVPVFSVNSEGPFQVLCMPYFGRQTLGDVLASIQETRTLPISGRSLLSTRIDGQKTTKPNEQPKPQPLPVTNPIEAVVKPEPPQPARELLTKLTFPESLVWVFARLAEGLAHAHENGILHLDLKPQNILITDAGVPMILDFGQAHDLKTGRGAPSGGTVRYMSPDHVRGFASNEFCPDERMDLYSLGVMLFELLTGRHPFDDSLEAKLSMRQIAAQRSVLPPKASSFNAAVPPALDAIVTKLLHPTVSKRYQSALQLAEDLNRQHTNRPLKYAGNPSTIERIRKFRRRHPVLLLWIVAISCTMSALSASGAAVYHQDRKRTQDVCVQAAKVNEAIGKLRVDLASPENARRRNAALDEARLIFRSYSVETNPQWKLNSEVTRLSAAEQERLFKNFGELALLCAYAERNNAFSTSDKDERKKHTREAVKWNRLSETSFPAGELPPVVREQRQWLAAQTGDSELGEELATATFAAESNIDHYQRALIFWANRQKEQAIATLEALTEREPSHSAAQLVLGVFYQTVGRFNDASERYQLAKVLCPTDPRPCQNRGNMLQLQRRDKDALAEFTAAIRRDDKFVDAYYYRAQSYVRLDKLEDALKDLKVSEKSEQFELRSHLLRTRIYRKQEKLDLVKLSQDVSEKFQPKDEVDYLARGLDRSHRKDYTGALEDYLQCTKINPGYLNGWQNQANILGEHLGQTEQAIDALDKVLEISAEYAPAQIGKAVLLARLGKRDEAHKSLKKALALSEDAMVTYQAACVMALTADAEHPEDKLQAMTYLRRALLNKFSDFKTLETDTDLNSIRDLKEFRDAVQSAKELRK